MAHNLNIENGQAAMMSVGVLPWHGLGVVLDSPPDTSDTEPTEEEKREEFDARQSIEQKARSESHEE